jgi:hypothetical protein
VQLAARERGLQHVARIHGPLGPARADDRVQLVDEEDDLAFLLREVLEHALQALLELAAELRARDQRTHVERENALPLQPFGHLAVHDALRETFDDRGLADAGLADQHGVVLRPPLQHLHGTADLIVAPDDGVELARCGALGEIDGVLLERAARALCIRVFHSLTAAHLFDRLPDGAFDGAGVLQRAIERTAILERREHEQLARDVLVATLLRELVGDVEETVQVVRDVQLAGRAFDLGQLVERRLEIRAQLVDVDAGAHEQRPHAAGVLLQHRQHDVRGLDDLMIAAERDGLRISQRFLELARQPVHSHVRDLSRRVWTREWGRKAPSSSGEPAVGPDGLRL